MACTTPNDCPDSPNDCKTPTCEGNTCGFALAAAKTACKDGGGKLCNDVGQCVDCITVAQCTSLIATPCSDAGIHTALPTCESGVCKTGQVEDCEAQGLACKPAGCKVCAIDLDCGPPGVCGYKTCKEGTCEQVISLSQGSPCPSPASGTCNAKGTCSLRKYVFVTSMTFHPSFGSTLMADAQCQAVATAANLGGQWMSWTSDSAGSTPLKRFTKSLVPYVLLDDQTIVASNWKALTSMMLLHGITLDEQKQQVMAPLEVWTGTSPDGTYAGNACSDWTPNNPNNFFGVVGSSGAIGNEWTSKKEQACSSQARLYCFQQ